MTVARVAVLVGLAGLAGWIAMALGRAEVMPSYLAAWLCWIAVPIGALPIVMASEALGLRAWPVMRRILLLLPAATVLAIPVLLRTAPLFRRAGVAAALPAAWMAPGFFVTRMIVILVVLSGLALLFSTPPGNRHRRALALLGLMLHVPLVSIAAVDWVMSLQPGLDSSAFGVVLIASQIGVAASLAAFVIAVGTPRGDILPRGLPSMLAVTLACWVAVHFIQYLVVWSANLPAEIVWYQARMAGLGTPFIWFAATASVVAVVLLPSRLGRLPAVLASVAAMLLLMHVMETLWLVTPAFNGRFGFGVADLLAVLGLGGLLVGLLTALLPRPAEGGRRAAA